MCGSDRTTLYPVDPRRDPTHIPHAGEARLGDGTYLYGGIKALALHGPRPSRSVAVSLWAVAANRTQAFRTAPSGTVPSVTKRHKAIISLRAIATSMIRRMRPLLEPTRSWNHCARVLPGW